VLQVQLVARNSVTTSPADVHFMLLASTAGVTWTSAVPVVAQVMLQAVSATVGYSACVYQVADIPAGATIAVGMTIGTSGATIFHGQIQGFLFP
jgi:hypothetical protein